MRLRRDLPDAGVHGVQRARRHQIAGLARRDVEARAFYAERHETHPLQNRANGHSRAHRSALQEPRRRAWSSGTASRAAHAAACGVVRAPALATGVGPGRSTAIRRTHKPSALSLPPRAVRPRSTLRRSLFRADAEGRSEIWDFRCRAIEGVQQLEVPKPARGYWAKKEAGRAVPAGRSSRLTPRQHPNTLGKRTCGERDDLRLGKPMIVVTVMIFDLRPFLVI